MTTALQEITQLQLTAFEKESILSHAVDLHLVGTDEADDAGFDLIDAKAEGVTHLFRITVDGKNAGVIYVLPFRNLPQHYEMTILIYASHRGQHITAEAVSQLERVMKSGGKATLCATVREHNPMRQELTRFLLKQGYAYDSEQMAFMKKLG